MNPDIMYAVCPACEENACGVQQMEIDDRRTRFGVWVVPGAGRSFHFLCVCPCGANWSVDVEEETGALYWVGLADVKRR